jgi:peroxin-3
MNIERDWAKLQESRKLEKIELKLKKEREEAALLREEQEAMEQLKEDDKVNESVVIVEADQQGSTEGTQEEKNTTEEIREEKSQQEEQPKSQLLKSPQFKSQGLDSSVGSLASSFNAEEDRPLPAGILSKKEKHLLWEEIKTKSNVSKKYTHREKEKVWDPLIEIVL